MNNSWVFSEVLNLIINGLPSIYQQGTGFDYISDTF